MKLVPKKYLRRNIIDLKEKIPLDELKEYNWFIEGQGRLHTCCSDNKYKTYSPEEIVKDGYISLLIQINQ